MDFDKDTTYVLTAPRTRVSWQELYGNMPITKSKRFKRGEKITGVPDERIMRLVEMGHAVPEDDWNPVEFRKLSAHRRLAMNQAAAADAAAAVANARASSGQPLVGLEDAEERSIDGIKVEDVDSLPKADEDDAADLAAITPGVGGESDVDVDGAPAGDTYDSMSYPDLVQAAKAKTNNGGGTKEELIARLREHDAQQ